MLDSLPAQREVASSLRVVGPAQSATSSGFAVDPTLFFDDGSDSIHRDRPAVPVVPISMPGRMPRPNASGGRSVTRHRCAAWSACIVGLLLCGCRQPGARLEISELRPEPAVTDEDPYNAPIVRAVPELDDRRTASETPPRRSPHTQVRPHDVEQRVATMTRPRRAASEDNPSRTVDRRTADSQPRRSSSRQTDDSKDRGAFGSGVGSLLGQRRSTKPGLLDQRRSDVVSVAFNEQAGVATNDVETRGLLDVPTDLPGAAAPDLQLPPYDANQPLDERREAIRELYQALPELPRERVVAAESGERPLTLMDLQQTAYGRSPVISRAWAEVDAARGRALQAGLCPNPVVGYEGDTINTLDTAGYNGVFFEQTYVTAGKLGLAQQAALMEVRGREYAYRRARVEVATSVRRAYFGVLVAEERARLARAMSALTQDAYNAQVDLVAGGQAAAYEPLQLKVTALKARNDVVTAENAYQGSWRELAAAMNYPNMLPEAIAGSVESPPADLQFDAARAALLSRHTDLSIAQADIAQQQCNLELQRRTPIPNLELYSAIQHDDTNSRNDVSYNVQVGLPLPIFNRNQGNIASANAELVRAQHNRVGTQNSLTASLAEAYARYATARELSETYRTQIIPSQVQTFRGVYTQFRSAGGDTDFAQVIVSQQTLSEVLGEYLDTLSNEWDAAVDVAEILQVEDIYSMDGIASPPHLGPGPAE